MNGIRTFDNDGLIDSYYDDKEIRIIPWELCAEYVKQKLPHSILRKVNVLSRQKSIEDLIEGKSYNICITGKLITFSNRSELIKKLINKGHKVIDSVSKNTDLLVNNDINSASSKNTKAKELGIDIISEDELIKFFMLR